MEKINKATLVINGTENEIDPGVPFTEAIGQFANKYKFTQVKVTMLDKSTNRMMAISLSKAPQIIQPGDRIEVSPWDEAA